MGNFVGHLSYHRFKPLVTIVCILVWDCYLRIGKECPADCKKMTAEIPASCGSGGQRHVGQARTETAAAKRRGF